MLRPVARGAGRAPSGGAGVQLARARANQIRSGADLLRAAGRATNLGARPAARGPRALIWRARVPFAPICICIRARHCICLRAASGAQLTLTIGRAPARALICIGARLVDLRASSGPCARPI